MEMKLKVSFALLLSHVFLLTLVAGAPEQAGLDMGISRASAQQVNLEQVEKSWKPDSAEKLGASEDILVRNLNWALGHLNTSEYTDGKMLFSQLSLQIAQTLKIVKELGLDV